MNFKRDQSAVAILIFAWLASNGCATTQLSGTRLTPEPPGPYAHVLACSMDSDSGRRAIEESAVRRELEKRPMKVTTCSEFFSPLKSSTNEQVRARFDEATFDAVLAWHRRPIIHMIDGPDKDSLEPLTLAGLLGAYRHRVLDRSADAARSDDRAQMTIQEGRQKVEQGEVHVLDVRTGHLVWNGRGAVLGATDAPPEVAADALARTAAYVLLRDRIIP